MHRFLFVTGFGIGTLLGMRAGHERYRQIVARSRAIAASDPVQNAVAEAQRGFDYATPRVRAFIKQTGLAAADYSERAVAATRTGAENLSDSVTTAVHDARERVESEATEFQHRVTETANDLRRRSDEMIEVGERQVEDLLRRGDELRELGEKQIEELRERMEAEIERQREASGEQVVKFGQARDDALAVWDDADDEHDGDDDMFEPGSKP